MTAVAAPPAPWLDRRTDESAVVEKHLRAAGFGRVDAYRYNPAVIRVRVIDSAFEGRTREQRFDRLDPALAALPEEIERDVIGVYPLTPAEADCSADGPHPRAAAMNWEFEHPDPSDDW